MLIKRKSKKVDNTKEIGFTATVYRTGKRLYITIPTGTCRVLDIIHRDEVEVTIKNKKNEVKDEQ